MSVTPKKNKIVAPTWALHFILTRLLFSLLGGLLPPLSPLSLLHSRALASTGHSTPAGPRAPLYSRPIAEGAKELCSGGGGEDDLDGV